MLDTMFELPGLTEVTGCVIDEDAVNGKSKPKLIEGIRRTHKGGVAAQQTTEEPE